MLSSTGHAKTTRFCGKPKKPKEGSFTSQWAPFKTSVLDANPKLSDDSSSPHFHLVLGDILNMPLGANYVPRPPLTWGETIDLPIRIFVFAPIQLIINYTQTILTILLRRLPPRYFLMCAAIRMFLATFTPAQIQLFLPPTVTTYGRFIRAARARARAAGHTALLEQLREDIEPIRGDSRAHLCWVGDRTKATRFVYFLHGGGYMAPALPGHFEWALQAYVVGGGGGKQRERTAVAVLQYTLAPGGRFPEQMRQAALGLRQLVDSGIQPSQLVVGGDSAGGNLASQLLGLALHPHYPPAADMPSLNLSEPLRGAFFVSPFVSADWDSQSFRDGAWCDMLQVAVFDSPRREMFHVPHGGLRGWLRPNAGLRESAAFVEGRKWALAVDVDDGEGWLDGVSRVVERVLVTVGRQEILRDQGLLFAEKLKRGDGAVDLRLEVAEKEAHDFILLEGERRVVGDATARMKAWYEGLWK